MLTRCTRLAAVLLAAAIAMLAGGCSAGSSPTDVLPGEFSLSVTPEVMNSLPGEKCVLLTTISDKSGGFNDGPVTISASCPGAQVSVEHASIMQGEVAEITVIPNEHAVSQLGPGGPDPDYILPVLIVGTRGTVVCGSTVQLNVIPSFPDEVGLYAVEMRRLFTGWLAENHPELGITPQTTWIGTMPSPLMAVQDYLYFSDKWEMHVFWNVMIPPYDYARIELRRRFTETSYSLGYEISSRTAVPAIEPVPMDPIDELWR